MIKQSGQNAKKGIGESLTVIDIIRGIVLSYIITIPIFIIFSIILTYVDYPEKLINPVVVVTTIISILAAGIYINRNTKRRGWLNGGIAGCVYMLVLYIIGSIIFSDFSVDRYVLTMFVIGILTGCIGGMLGINIKGKRTSHKYKIRKG
jgi:putative membrane protein (TIGR04086 family)